MNLDQERNEFVRKNLVKFFRMYSMNWPPRKNALRKQQVGSGHYLCQKCNKIRPKNLIRVDHILPAVPPKTGFDYTEFIERLFCGMDGFQVLCTECHQEKTNIENSTRNRGAKTRPSANTPEEVAT